MEHKGIIEIILQRFLAEMKSDDVLGEELSAKIIKLVEEGKCKKETLGEMLKKSENKK